MTEICRRATVDASPEVVWAVLADFAAISDWAANVDHSCLLTEQTEGVGTARRIQTGRITVVETVKAWTPPGPGSGGELAYSITGLPPIIRSVTNHWRLEPATIDGTPHTAVTLTTTVNAGRRPPQQAIATIVARRLARASDVMIAGLAARSTAPLIIPPIATQVNP
jgi:hypothetical protein